MKISAKDSLGLHELKQHKPWFYEKCSRFLDQRKQAKMQWLQDPNQTNANNVNNVQLVDISGTRRRNIGKLKLTNLKVIGGSNYQALL